MAATRGSPSNIFISDATNSHIEFIKESIKCKDTFRPTEIIFKKSLWVGGL